MTTITRRSFGAAAGAGLIGCSAQRPRPNILWLTSEDMGPEMSCYGDTYASTPNLDRLAARGLIYSNAWSTAPVCAPARTTIISGLYPPCTGSEHMRSTASLPEGFKMYPQYLREAGYYATNNEKEDYNLEKPGQVWDESSAKAHWRNRKPDQPFFSIFNFMTTHESQLRRRPHELVHDPAKLRLPAYHPDTPEVRHDWAQYYDNITTMDKQAAGMLAQLEQDGLADSTIIFFYGDHGSGMPRSKRWPYNSGLHVPLIVYVPDKFRHLAPKDYRPGGKTDRLVGFIDLAPTLLSLVGVKPPEHMQGHAFMGEFSAPEQGYLYGFRGRMDERFDMVRSVRDKRYVYIRNYMPHKPYGQHVSYMFETPTTRVWKDLYDKGKLKPPKTHFWEAKPPEELYDLEKDPDEVQNLAKSPEHQEIRSRMRKAQQDLAAGIRDVGFLPEGEIHSRSKGSTPYEMGHDEQRYALKKIMTAAELASSGAPDAAVKLLTWFDDADSAVRYWVVTGILARGADAVRSAAGPLRGKLTDASPYVRVVAAEALGRFGSADDLQKALDVLIELAPADKNGAYVAMMAMNAIGELGAKARPLKNKIAVLPEEDPSAPKRANGYVSRLIKTSLADLRQDH